MQRSLDNTEKALAKLSLLASAEDRAKLTAERDDLRRRLKMFGVTGERDTDTMAPAPAAGPAKVTSDAEYNALPSGTTFIGPDGKTRRKP